MSWRKNPHDSSKHGEVPAQSEIKQHNKMIGVAALATFSAIFLLVVACVVALCCAMPNFVDNANAPTSSVSHSVGVSRLQSVCPIRLSLPDLAQYGDSQYNESEGDLQSSARYSTFGDVYRASVHNIRDTNDESTLLSKKLNNDGTSSLTYDGDVNHDAQVLEGRLSNIASGTGIAASMASWATKGDVRGLSATTCSIPTMKQTFLVPESGEGVSIRLEAFNPASKPTVVRVRAWSAKRGSNPINLSTGSAFTVPAHSHAYFDLSAAAPKSSGLYAQVESEQTPIAAFVKVVHMSGLTVKGVDIIRALSAMSYETVLSGINESEQAKAYVWPDKDGKVTISWMNDSGAQTVKDLSVKSHNLQVIDLGKVPEKVHALSITGSVKTSAMMSVSRDGKDGQSDIAFISASRSQGISAIVSPVSAEETTLYIASTSDSDSSVFLQAVGASGMKRVSVPAHSVVTVPASDISHNAVMFTVKSSKNISLSARIRKDDLDKANVAGIAWLASQSLEPQQAQVHVNSDNHIVQ